jgi:hypothetical protein
VTKQQPAVNIIMLITHIVLTSLAYPSHEGMPHSQLERIGHVTDIPALAQRLQITTTETVQQWVDKAEDESVGEIMVEICDDQVPVVDVLTRR